jgi:maltose phosphorylase
MAKFSLEYTIKKIKEIQAEDPDTYKKVADKVAFDESETTDWKNMADNMIIIYDDETKLFEQHDGFFKLPHLDVDSIPVEDFPLYDNWSYDRIYRNDMIKQPDVLMFMLLFNSDFSKEQLKANYEYYEPCCIHESSLSPSVHSILASQLGKDDEAYDFFGFATRMDLDNYNRNTNQGIHTTSIAAAWMNIVYGFGGLRSDGEKLSVSPSLPKNWGGYSFKISYQGVVIEIDVDKENVCIKTNGDKSVELNVYGKDVEINSEGYKCEMV